MFEIQFFGTSASAPSIQRGLPSLMVRHNDQRFLIDCGEGTQRQILLAGCGFKNLSKIFFTHGHLDHILGSAGLISTLSRWEDITKIELFGGADAIERIRELINIVVLRGNKTDVNILYHKLNEGLFLDFKDFSVSCFPVSHRGSDSFGYLFAEKDRRPFLKDIAQELGIPAGPWRKDLANGKEAHLPDGRTIASEAVLGETIHGVKLAIIGDTGKTETLLPYVKGADTLIIESTYLKDEADKATQYGHITAEQAARFALNAGVKQLILTHISRRHTERAILAEAKPIFENTFAARDLAEYCVKHDPNES